MRLRSNTTLCVDEVVVEEIAPSPDEAQSYPAGSGVVVTLSLKRDWREPRATLSALSGGYEGHDVAWLDDHRITLVDVVDAHRNRRVALRIERVTDELTGAPAHLVRASKEQDVALDEHTRLRFLYHGHKIVSSEGELSPLLAAVELLPAGREPEQQHLTLGPEEDRMVWTWRDYRFTVRDVLYGEWMDLTVERLKLEPVEPGEA